MNKRELASVHRKLERCKERLAKDRDTLRTLMEEYEEILSVSQDAVDDIEHAVETLSQYL